MSADNSMDAPEKKLFADRVIVITGAGGLIGRALALGFLNDGAYVVGVGRKAEPLEDMFRPYSSQVMCLEADLSEVKACTEVIDTICRQMGRIDVLVNAAGLSGAGNFLEVELRQWVDTFAVNLLSVAACSYAALPGMIRRRHGRIVNFGTRLSMRCRTGLAAYAVSKNAMSSLTRALAKELRAEHPYILVNDIIPGLTRAEAINGAQRPEAVYPSVRDMVLLEDGTRSGQVYFRGHWYEYSSSFDPVDPAGPDQMPLA
jgi:Short-chain dehydrogenases of various substrate specificities|nr:SDR family oxidoreductase [uncultured Steroidobacter sp.]